MHRVMNGMVGVQKVYTIEIFQGREIRNYQHGPECDDCDLLEDE